MSEVTILADNAQESEGLREIPASEILDKIKNGESVVYDNVIIREDLNLSSLDLQIQHIDPIDPQKSLRSSDFKLVASEIKISNSSIAGRLEFGNIMFQKSIIFHRTRFKGDADFRGSQFSGYADFGNSKFSEKVSFDSASFSKRMILNDSRIYFMNLRAKFNEDSTISLKHSDFHKLEVHWADIKNRFVYDGSAYLALVKNYNNLEWFDEADSCYYDYKINRIKKDTNLKLKDKIGDFISFAAYGYGVRPEYPLIGLVMIFIVSAIIYSLQGQTNFPGTLGLSAVVLTTTNQIEGLTETCKCWSIIERVLGWLLMSTFLVSLGKKTLR